MRGKMADTLNERYGESAGASALEDAGDTLKGMLNRGSCRVYKSEPIADEVLSLLCAAALASPTKSDLQQRDILIVRDPELRNWFDELFPDMPWIADAPHFLVFIGNHRRQRQIHELRGRPFANDHLDAFFNAAVDAGVALSAFITAAEALGLGCCPISAVRNHAAAVSERLDLPDYVFPICGLTLGHPVYPPRISPRLPISMTVHEDRFTDDTAADGIDAYDSRRNETRPFSSQRRSDVFGEAEVYGWSEDKARQYALPEREDFGRFVLEKGFKLD